MITDKEYNAVQLSATKRDYYQIWNELLDTAKKLSDIWDPTATNESDPGIVLLKVLTAIADKLNYTIDKNTLEAFMPSATQMESMRKLCEMLGYNIKYYNSASTAVTVTCNPDALTDEPTTKSLPIFTNISNTDNTINYFTIDTISFGKNNLTSTVDCIEGTFVDCQTKDGTNNITVDLLDDNNRYYLPENQIAENGIFIKNSTKSWGKNTIWKKVQNLNTASLGGTYYKFGFDSKENRPYIEFPKDANSLFEEGINIRYTRTNGLNGNIAVGTLSTVHFEENTDDKLEENTNIFSANNGSIVTNGTNIETIKQAYNNYKKTIGTFDTLVTCRDYMNKIYQLTFEDSTRPMVSNVIVSDIRDDINDAFELCSFNEYGLNYITTAKTDSISGKAAIECFDLKIYPFKPYNNLGTKSDFIESFKYSDSNLNDIEEALDDYKTIAHKLKGADPGDLVCIKNYLKLNARLITNHKVWELEEKEIINNVKTALYQEFNLRNLDFGEELPYEDILSCIEQADTRIKNVVLDEPVLETRFLLKNGNEIDSTKPEEYNNYLESLALQNILAGRISLFKYNELVKTSYNEQKYPGTTFSNFSEITKMESSLVVDVEKINDTSTDEKNKKLTANETIKFRAPSFKTTVTYPAYVNYYLLLAGTGEGAIAANFIDLAKYFKENKEASTVNGFIDTINNHTGRDKFFQARTYKDGDVELFGVFFYKGADGKYIFLDSPQSQPHRKCFVLDINDDTIATWHDFITGTGETQLNLTGIYQRLSADMSRPVGKFVDSEHRKYTIRTTPASGWNLNQYFIQNVVEGDTTKGVGRDAKPKFIPAGSEYKLANDEYLFINYTQPASEDGKQPESIINKLYPAGTIIKPKKDLYNSSEDIRAKTKTTGFNFKDYTGEPINGMYAFGADEQVEIREPVEVKLFGDNINLYWILQTDNANFAHAQDSEEESKEAKSKIEFNEDPVLDESGKKNYTAYTLKEGEYFFYTDSNKFDMAYYGYGTKLIKAANTPDLERPIKKIITADEIFTGGLAADIDWKLFSLGKEDNNKFLTIKEYQYKTLAAGDTLLKCELSNISDVAVTELDNTWKPCASAEYLLADGTRTSLPDIIGDNGNSLWEVRSGLDFNLSSLANQVLRKTDIFTDTIKITQKNGGVKYLVPQETTGDTTTFTPLALKSNYTCKTSSDSVSVDFMLTYDEDIKKDINFSIYCSEEKTLQKQTAAGNISYELVPFDKNSNWYEIILEAGESVELYTKIPYNNFGLIMINYTAGFDGKEDDIHKGLKVTPTPRTSTLKIFNNDGGWWTEAEGEDRYGGGYLKKSSNNGMNILGLDDTCTSIKIEADKESTEGGTIIIGNLNIIKNGDELNPHLGLPEKFGSGSEEKSAYNRLLSDIKQLDPDYKFYYNAVINNSTAISINTLNTDIASDTFESLATPKIWYDYNNKCNKFVISEIDADYLNKGITITKSSKI